MSRGIVQAETLVDDAVNAALRRVLELFLQEHSERVASAHRLAYVFIDDDTLDEKGKPTQIMVCKCGEGLVRRKHNEHIKDKYKEVG